MIEETGEYDLEGLFVRLNHAIDSIGAKRVLLDTVEALFAGLSNESILRAELRRLFMWLKQKGVTAVITGEKGAGTLTRHGLEEYVSDCVIVLDHGISNSVSTRRLRVVKYRGSTHGSNEYPFLIDHAGFSVLPLTSVERLDEKSVPDIFLMDWSLPRVHGKGVLEAIGHSSSLQRTPRVVLTSSESPIDRTDVEGLGGVFVSKPRSLDEFMQIGRRVKSILDASS